MRKLGVDTGGTFTDFVLLEAGRLRVHKVLSTPDAPERAILQGVAELAVERAGLAVVHGSTVATNAVLEGKGARTAYITNRGFADVLTIGRQARRDLYDLEPPPRRPPVPPELCLEVGARLAPDGRELAPLTEADLAALRAAVERLAPDAVAINLLFSFVDDRHERAIASALPQDLFVARSSAVLAEYREYERGMATWLNAYVGPLMDRYLARLSAALAPARVSVMQSHGGTIDAGQAGAQAVHLLLSGPAGGLVGALAQGRRSGFERLMSFDMGGTSTDVALLDGDIGLTSEGEIAGYPVAVPMVDMHTIGAGGGSIAWLDAGGLLQVGPQSAGAAPGPACYGQGGREPTVTDANVVLGRLPADLPLAGGSLRLDGEAARRAVGRLAERLGLGLAEAARGILRIANEHMAQALRVISVQRGHDPRDFCLLGFGGAGGMHVCALAEQLGMRQALVPRQAGVLSALGMVVARRSRQASHSLLRPLERFGPGALAVELAGLRERLAAAMRAEVGDEARLVFHASLDLRYQGQSSTLNLPWDGAPPAAVARAFHAAHEGQFGHALAMPVELVNLRLQVSVDEPLPDFAEPLPATPAAPVAHVPVHGCPDPVPVFEREALAVGQSVSGPAILREAVATTWLAPGWRALCDAVGNLLLTRVDAAG